MPAKDLGTKHTCFKCGTKFYDMKKPEPICPKCGADQRQSTAKASPAAERRSRPAKPVAPVAVEPEAEEVEAELDDEEGDEDADEADEDEP